MVGSFGLLVLLSMDCLFSCRSISVAPMRGGSHFLCCCKESNQRNSYPHPKYFTPAPAQKHSRGPAVASALIGLIGLGPRTVCQARSYSALVQHQRAPAQRYALPLGLQGTPTNHKCSEMEALAKKRAHPRWTGRPRSGPELFGALPVS